MPTFNNPGATVTDTPTEQSETTVLNNGNTIPDTMRSVVRYRYGGPETLEVATVETPAPEAGQLLIKVHASSVNPLDWHVTAGKPKIMRLMFGLRRPKRPFIGADVAGEVVALGPGVSEFSIGDRVYSESSAAWSEYAIVKAANAAQIPDSIGYAEMGTVPVAALTAIQGLRDWGGLQSGQTVLINGASGGVGIFAVQIAKLLGASEVVGVCSGRNAEMVESLGADRVIDYTACDFIEEAGQFDVFLDNIGHQSLSSSLKALTPQGTYVMVSGKKGDYIAPVPRMVWSKVMNLFTRKRFAGGTAAVSGSDLAQIARWMEAGELRTVIDRQFTLDDASEALAYLETNRTRGKSVVQVVGALTEGRD